MPPLNVSTGVCWGGVGPQANKFEQVSSDNQLPDATSRGWACPGEWVCMKNTWNFTIKKLEISLNFVSPKKWEP